MKIFLNCMGLAFMLVVALPPANAATFNVLVGEQEVATLSLFSSSRGAFQSQL